MGFWVMLFSFILGAVSLYYGLKKKGSASINNAAIIIGVLLMLFSIYLALPK